MTFKEGDLVEWKHKSKHNHKYIIVEIYPRGLFRRTNQYKCIRQDEEQFMFYEGELKLSKTNKKK